MKRTAAGISCILTLLTFGLLCSSFGQGSLTPPGAPAPTMKSLDQIESRAIITNLPYVITSAGSYYLTGNLTGTAGTNGITVTVDNVSIDLNGFSLIGKPGSSNGVFAITGIRNLSLCNGSIKSWGRSGVATINATFSRFEKLQATSNSGTGIDTGNGSVISQCTAASNSDTGISGGNGSTVRDCTAQSNGATGINGYFGSTIIGCAVQGNTGAGISANGAGTTIKDCAAQNNAGGGISTAGTCTITGCSVSGNTGIGIATAFSTVENCTVNNNTGDGIYITSNGNILHNNLYANGGFNNLNNNIHVTGSYNRIEGNHATLGYTNIRVDSIGNVIIQNSAGGSSIANFNVAANNLFGPTLGSAATMATNSNPHANYSF